MPQLQKNLRFPLPSNHARSDSAALIFIMSITGSVQPESARIVYAGSDFPHPIRLGSSREGPDRLVQNRPGSDLDGLVRFGPNASGQEASRCAKINGPGFGRAQLARYQFPTFRLGCFLPETARVILCKTSPDPIGSG